ncbi:MAG: hypothetical protein Q8K63_05325, partial [Acidimicrobiales bacterium]|nr:hypothetical protein [Acidimicrobiales bacterium]
MISTLNDVRVYTEHRASRSPLQAERVLLRTPGISAEEASVLEHTLPGLPASYLKCAKQFSLATVELGMAALRP